MIEHQATWEDVQVGHHIKDKTGRVWRVTEFDADGVCMESGEKKGAIALPAALAPVTIVILSTTEMVEFELDGTEIT